MNGSQLVTVFGGTGFLGSRVVRQLCEGGCRVRIASRHPRSRPELLRARQAEPVRADLLDASTLPAALSGADAAVNATSLYVEKGGLTFDAVHVQAAGRLALLAKERKLRRFVHVSGIGSDPEARDGYIRARGKGEIAVRDGFPSAVIARSAVMFGPDDAFLSAILGTARRLPFYPLFGRGETRLQPVQVDDVARAISRVLRADDVSPCYELAGPDVFSYRELVEAVAEAAGISVRSVPVPFPLWRALAFAAERLPAAPLTRSQVALVEKDNVAALDLPGFFELGVSAQSVVDFVRRSEG
jgi:uncharacterized protein YbjT (DUF2867 family)